MALRCDLLALRIALTGAAVLCASAAIADTVNEVTPCCAPPQCLADLAGAPEEAGLSPYSIRLPGEGVVAYETEDAARGLWLGIVETCETREQMVWSRPAASGGALAPRPLQELFDGMLDGEEAVTLHDIARRLSEAGEAAQVRRVTYESCGCRLEREG